MLCPVLCKSIRSKNNSRWKTTARGKRSRFFAGKKWIRDLWSRFLLAIESTTQSLITSYSRERPYVVPLWCSFRAVQSLESDPFCLKGVRSVRRDGIFQEVVDYENWCLNWELIQTGFHEGGYLGRWKLVRYFKYSVQRRTDSNGVS